MKNIAILIIVISLTSCMASTPNRPSLVPKTAYVTIGASVYSPDDSGWFLAQSSNTFVAFGKQYGTPNDTAIANTIIFKVEGYESDSDFLNYIAEQRKKNDDKNRFKVLNMSNEQVAFKNTACLKYRWLSEDHKNNGINSSDFQYFKTTGYVCRHPFNKIIAFQMEVSHRSNTKELREGLLSISESFFSTIQFNK